MTDIQSDLKELKEKAEQATPGPWKAEKIPPNPRTRIVEYSQEFPIHQVIAEVLSWRTSLVLDTGDADGLFIAACSPDRILRVVEYVRWLQKKVPAVIEEYAEAYPVDIFPEPSAGQHGQTVDACSARALRGILPRVLRDVREVLAGHPDAEEKHSKGTVDTDFNGGETD